jgi:hypothetical protein
VGPRAGGAGRRCPVVRAPTIPAAARAKGPAAPRRGGAHAAGPAAPPPAPAAAAPRPPPPRPPPLRAPRRTVPRRAVDALDAAQRLVGAAIGDVRAAGGAVALHLAERRAAVDGDLQAHARVCVGGGWRWRVGGWARREQGRRRGAGGGRLAATLTGERGSKRALSGRAHLFNPPVRPKVLPVRQHLEVGERRGRRQAGRGEGMRWGGGGRYGCARAAAARRARARWQSPQPRIPKLLRPPLPDALARGCTQAPLLRPPPFGPWGSAPPPSTAAAGGPQHRPGSAAPPGLAAGREQRGIEGRGEGRVGGALNAAAAGARCSSTHAQVRAPGRAAAAAAAGPRAAATPRAPLSPDSPAATAGAGRAGAGAGRAGPRARAAAAAAPTRAHRQVLRQAPRRRDRRGALLLDLLLALLLLGRPAGGRRPRLSGSSGLEDSMPTHRDPRARPRGPPRPPHTSVSIWVMVMFSLTYSARQFGHRAGRFSLLAVSMTVLKHHRHMEYPHGQ